MEFLLWIERLNATTETLARRPTSKEIVFVRRPRTLTLRVFTYARREQGKQVRYELRRDMRGKQEGDDPACSYHIKGCIRDG